MLTARTIYPVKTDYVVAVDADGCLYNAVYNKLIAVLILRYQQKLINCANKPDQSELLYTEIENFLMDFKISDLNNLSELKKPPYSSSPEMAPHRFAILEMLPYRIHGLLALKSNTALSNILIALAKQGSVSIACFSNRYDELNDVFNARNNGTGFIYNDLNHMCLELTKHHPHFSFQLLTPTITDAINHHPPGANFNYNLDRYQNDIRKINFTVLFDSSKFLSLILLSNYATRSLFVIDDHDDILTRLHDTIDMHPTLLPPITLNIIQYTGTIKYEKIIECEGSYSKMLENDIRTAANMAGYPFTNNPQSTKTYANIDVLASIDISQLEKILNPNKPQRFRP